MRSTTLLLVTTALLLAAPALAQTGTADTAAPQQTADTIAPGEIIVTAQKRSENVQRVPVAVTVLGGAQLEALGGINIENAQYLVPTLNFRKSGAAINQFLFLRGIGTSTFSIAGEPSVSTVLDGVVLSRAGEAFTDLVDIERIEVLRGPQGTLFGKNASAGVINIVTRKPTNSLEGYGEVGYASDGEYRGRAALNIPIGSTIKTRLTGFYDDWDGNLRNTVYNKTVNGFRHYGFRGIVEADISPDVKATLIGDWRRSRDNCCAEVIGSTPSNPLLLAALPTPLGDRTRSVSTNLIGRNEEESWGVSLQLDATAGPLTFTSITAYRDYSDREVRDGDFLPQAYVGVPQLADGGPQTGQTFSQEFRLTSPNHGVLTYVVGAYYSHSYSERIFTRSNVACGLTPSQPAPNTLVPCGSPPAAPSSFPFARADFGSTFQNVAVFGQGTAHVTDKLRGIIGLRYTLDQLDVFHSRVTTLSGAGINPSFDAGVYNNGATVTSPTGAVSFKPGPANGVPYRNRTNKDNLSGKAGLQYDLTRDIIVYGTYARGYKGPAFNTFFNLTTTGAGPIAPETSDSYEGGLKIAFLDRRLTLNLAGYFAKYYNFQANNPDIVAGVLTTRFTNAGEVSTRGGEADLLFRANRDVTLSGGIAYTDAHIDRFKLPPGAAATAVIPSGTPLAYAPKIKAALGGEYRLRTNSFADVLLGAQGSFQSSEISQVDAVAANRANTTIHSYGLLDLSASLVDHADKYKLTLQVKNVLDQSFSASITTGGPGNALRHIIPREADRYVGVSLRANFGGR